MTDSKENYHLVLGSERLNRTVPGKLVPLAKLQLVEVSEGNPWWGHSVFPKDSQYNFWHHLSLQMHFHQCMSWGVQPWLMWPPHCYKTNKGSHLQTFACTTVHREICNGVFKVNQDCIVFPLPHSMIFPENLCHSDQMQN